MKKYYIRYYREAGNTFELRWLDNKEDEEIAIAEGFKRITRKEAIKKCINAREEERVTGKAWGSTDILPLNIKPNSYLSDFNTDDGYIIKHTNKQNKNIKNKI